MALHPVVVRPRWAFHVALVLAAALAAAVLLVVRRDDDLDLEDQIVSAIALVGVCWVFAFALAALVRNLRAGYGLRLDADGVHLPGLAVVPWDAIAEVSFHRPSDAWWRAGELRLRVDPAALARAAPGYERYLFGPFAGWIGGRDRLSIPIGVLAMDGRALCASMDQMRSTAAARRAVRANAGTAARERGQTRRRLP